MRKKILFFLATFILAATLSHAETQEKKNTPIDKAAAQQLARKYACLSCHAIDRKLVGPSYIEIANKYKHNSKAAELLTKKIRIGGVGVWGQVPMPANSAIKDDELKIVVAWILAGAPK